MPVITISGSLASGAREIAQATAAGLGLDYVDQEILVEAAQRLGVSVSAVESRDERPSSIGERIGSVLRTMMERSVAAGATDPITGGGLEMVLGRTYGEAAELPSDAPRGQLDDESYLRTLTAVINGIAARGNVIILGRGGQAILQHHPEAMHVCIVAGREERIENLMQRDGLSEQEAEHRIKHSDQNRQAFHRRFFKVDAENPRLYNVMIHSGRISPAGAIALIEVAARERTPRAG
jgi:cytidylate kinase